MAMPRAAALRGLLGLSIHAWTAAGQSTVTERWTAADLGYGDSIFAQLVAEERNGQQLADPASCCESGCLQLGSCCYPACGNNGEPMSSSRTASASPAAEPAAAAGWAGPSPEPHPAFAECSWRADISTPPDPDNDGYYAACLCDLGDGSFCASSGPHCGGWDNGFATAPNEFFPLPAEHAGCQDNGWTGNHLYTAACPAVCTGSAAAAQPSAEPAAGTGGERPEVVVMTSVYSATELVAARVAMRQAAVSDALVVTVASSISFPLPIEAIAAGTEARERFEADFKAQMANKLGGGGVLKADDVLIDSVQAGSVEVAFHFKAPATVMTEAASMLTTLAASSQSIAVTVGGTTVTAKTSSLAPPVVRKTAEPAEGAAPLAPLAPLVPLVPTGASPLHLLAAAAGGAALMLLVIFGLRRCSSGRSKVGSAGGGANLVPVLLVQGAGNFGDIRLANPEACYDSGQWDTMTEKRTKRKKMKRTDLERGNGGPALMHGGNNKCPPLLSTVAPPPILAKRCLRLFALLNSPSAAGTTQCLPSPACRMRSGPPSSRFRPGAPRCRDHGPHHCLLVTTSEQGR